MPVLRSEIALGILENAKLNRNAGPDAQQWSQGALVVGIVRG